jgi:hypothetical protein
MLLKTNKKIKSLMNLLKFPFMISFEIHVYERLNEKILNAGNLTLILLT